MDTRRKGQKGGEGEGEASRDWEENDAPADPESVKSVEVAGRILRALASQATQISLNEVAKLAGMAPSKAHRYLSSLIKVGLVDQNLGDRRYGLGWFSIELGAIASRMSDPVSEAIERLRCLREKLDETLTLAVWSSAGPLVIEVAESSRPIVMTMKRGTLLPLLNTATGLIYCALLPRSQTADLVAIELATAQQSNPIVSEQAELDELLKQVAQQGYALNAGHLLPDVMAIAAPIFTRSNGLTAVLAVFGRENRIDPARNPAPLAALLDACNSPLPVLRGVLKG